jgi:hypothetical protein
LLAISGALLASICLSFSALLELRLVLSPRCLPILLISAAGLAVLSHGILPILLIRTPAPLGRAPAGETAAARRTSASKSAASTRSRASTARPGTPAASATLGKRIRLNERNKDQDGRALDYGPFNKRRDFHCLDPFFE